jgi:tetratricopeptide (TPR) repeat protein
MPSRALAIALTLSLPACAPAEPPRPVDELIADARQLDLDGRQDEAARLFRDALAQAPDSFDAHYGLARALDLAGAYDEARMHFARAIDLSPEGSRDQAVRMMGIAWTFAGNAEEAAPYFEQVFQRRLDAGIYSGAAEVANELGRVYLELGNADLAETWYRRGVDTAALEDDRPAWQADLAALRWAHAQARIAARRGQHADAARHATNVRTILDRGGNDDQAPQYPHLLGYLALESGDTDAALAHLATADQSDPFVLLLQARAAARGGDASHARAFYEQVLTSNSHAVANAFARPEAKAETGGDD